MAVARESFGKMPDKSPVEAFTLSAGAFSVRLTTLGAAIMGVCVPDRAGVLRDVVCGFDRAEDCLAAGGYYGVVPGRVSNRIAGASFRLNGKDYALEANDGRNCLHGGNSGFAYRLWTPEVLASGETPEICFSYVSPDGEGGFPGKLLTRTRYRLSPDGMLAILLEAETDRSTVVNLTSHAYFNLDGYDAPSVLEQVLWLNADRINEIDGELIPTGRLLPVAGTPYDFTVPKPLGRDLAALTALGGYDNNFFLRGEGGLSHAATLVSSASGIRMQLLTDQKCVQLYTGNMIEEKDPPYKNGASRRIHGAVCLEAQDMPDAVHYPALADIRLNPGETYRRTILFRFDTVQQVS